MTFLICLVTSLITSKFMVISHYGQYGKKKQFIVDHWDDIVQMRKTMSAARVAKVYGGYIDVRSIYQYEKLFAK